MRQLKAILGKTRFLKNDESGSSTIGLVVVFPFVFFVFCTAMEVSLLAMRKVQIASAAVEVSRFLRIASNTPPEQGALVNLLCDASVLVADCPNAITVELSPVDTVNWTANAQAMQCVDRQAGFVPAEEYIAGDNNQLMLLRICAVFKPLFPNFGIGHSLVQAEGGDYAILDVSYFTNEPTS